MKTQEVHELIPGMDFRDRLPRSTEGHPLKALLFGRANVGQKGGRAAAEVVAKLQAEGLPVQLIVRGVPADKVQEERDILNDTMDA